MRPLLLWSVTVASICLAATGTWSLTRPEPSGSVEFAIQDPTGKYPGDGTSFAVAIRVSNTGREPARILSVGTG